MIEVRAYNAEGKEDGVVSVSEEWFGGHVRGEVLREAVLMYETNRRQGNASVLYRGEVQGSTRKLWRQKHTGRARVGDRRSPIRRGGGSVWGPKPRDYSYRLTKKALKAALDTALLARMQDGAVIVADCRVGDPPKTKTVAKYLSAIGIGEGVSVLYVTNGVDRQFVRGARNIEKVGIMPLSDINAYEVVRPKAVVFSKGAFEKLLEGRR